MHITSRKCRRLPGLALAALAILALSLPAQAQWKWRDARGQINISDTPPPRDIPAKDILQQPGAVARSPAPAAPLPAASAAPASAADAKAAVDPKLEERKRRIEQEQAAAAKADERKAAALRQDNCRRAREQLALLDSGQRIMRVKADGEREIMDDMMRAQETQRARAVVASDCR